MGIDQRAVGDSQAGNADVATPNIVQRCSYAHNKFAQHIQFTVGRPADFDSAYFSESESLKLAYITDITRFTRLATRLK